MSPSTMLHVLLHYIWFKVAAKATVIGLIVFQLSQNETWYSQVLFRADTVLWSAHATFFINQTTDELRKETISRLFDNESNITSL